MAIDFDPCSSTPLVARATLARALSVKARAVVLEVVVQMLPAQIGEQIVLISLLPASSFVPDWCVRSFSLIAGAFAGRPLLQDTAPNGGSRYNSPMAGDRFSDRRVLPHST